MHPLGKLENYGQSVWFDYIRPITKNSPFELMTFLYFIKAECAGYASSRHQFPLLASEAPPQSFEYFSH